MHTFEEIHEKRLKDIEDYGISVQGVFPTKDDDGPLFSYTIGMTLVSKPEIILFDFDLEDACRLLNCVWDGLEHAELETGKAIDFDGYLSMALFFMDIPDEAAKEYACGAYNYFPEAKAVQMILPDVEGRFPWQEGCAKPFSAQKLLTKDGFTPFTIQ